MYDRPRADGGGHSDRRGRSLGLPEITDEPAASTLRNYLRAGRTTYALTIAEREQILRALDHPPDGLTELRAVLLREHEWRVREGLVYLAQQLAEGGLRAASPTSRVTERLRERPSRRRVSRGSDGESAHAPPAPGCAAYRRPPGSQRRRSVGAGRQAVQDTIGSTPAGGSKSRPRLP
jgi:hypothetical protein